MKSSASSKLPILFSLTIHAIILLLMMVNIRLPLNVGGLSSINQREFIKFKVSQPKNIEYREIEPSEFETMPSSETLLEAPQPPEYDAPEESTFEIPEPSRFVERHQTISEREWTYKLPRQPSASDTLQHPRPLHNPLPEYPLIARVRGWEGMVKVRCLVASNGQVSDVLIVSSSGYPALDEAVKRAVLRWVFEPLTSKKEIELSFRFILKDR